MTGAVVYLDASAIVKLVAPEAERPALREFLLDKPRRITSLLAAVEVPRAVARRAGHLPERLASVFTGLILIELSRSVATRAAALQPAALRSLDAIHLASALEFGEDLEVFITYDERLAAAARGLGMPVASPA
jgi:predicted nucleic acid-binding protein